jgi:hypothetical protein
VTACKMSAASTCPSPPSASAEEKASLLARAVVAPRICSIADERKLTGRMVLIRGSTARVKDQRPPRSSLLGRYVPFE